MRRQYFYKLTVSGRGPFPMDMLRHDECWPADTTSAMTIQDTNPFNDGDRRTGGRTIVLCSFRAPTVARWNSFGWYCDVEATRMFYVKDVEEEA